METKINVVKILKDKPKGTKLYSSACGKCKLEEVDDKSFKISFYNSKFGFMNGGEGYLDKNGKLYDDGECVVFPSKEMRDWRKFAWKKGDVLESNNGKVEVIFEKFDSDTYQSFIGKHHLDSLDENLYYQDGGVYPTASFNIETEDAAQTYISTIEERLGGRLNRETLVVEKPQPEFKDGDIVVTDAAPYSCYSKCIFILKGDLNTNENSANSYVFFNINNNRISFDVLDTTIIDRNIHLATDSEKQQLFDAIEKDGKVWNAEKKAILDLKPKVEFKPFDKVLVRDSRVSKWRANLFSHKNIDEPYYCVYASWNYCIPYEGNEHLLGTTKDSK